MKFLSDLRLKWQLYKMSEFGRAVYYCMQKPEDWDFERSEHFVVHKPTDIAFWTGNGAPHFAPYHTHNKLAEKSCKQMFTNRDRVILHQELVRTQTRILSGRMAASLLGE